MESVNFSEDRFYDCKGNQQEYRVKKQFLGDKFQVWHAEYNDVNLCYVDMATICTVNHRDKKITWEDISKLPYPGDLPAYPGEDEIDSEIDKLLRGFNKTKKMSISYDPIDKFIIDDLIEKLKESGINVTVSHH
jgi:hypothetical protein